MAVQGVKYIDMTGQQHTALLDDVDAAYLDPLGRMLLQKSDAEQCRCNVVL